MDLLFALKLCRILNKYKMSFTFYMVDALNKVFLKHDRRDLEIK